MTRSKSIIDEKSGRRFIIHGFCPVDVKEIYEVEGLNTHRYLQGDYCIEIYDQNKTTYITDFCGTYSAKRLPRNSTIVIEDNKIIYKADNINLSPFHYSEIPRSSTLDQFFTAIDDAVKLRCTNYPTILMSSGQDSGTIVASALKQDLEFNTLTITGLEDTDIINDRLTRVKDSKVVSEWENGTDSHLVAAMNAPSKIILSGLGADELYWSGDFQLMERFIAASYEHYKEYDIQMRYPLLDCKVYVQFFILKDKYKKRKKPLIEYLHKEFFPHKPNLKIPFYLGK
jgi:asparagine synthetase B (glutamine-hydrolysing)